MKFSTNHVLTVANQSTPTFQLFKSVSIHDEYFKIHAGLMASKKDGIHKYSHRTILTI